MAGTLLLVAKDQTNQSAFKELQNKLKAKTKEVFGSFFPEIHFKNPTPDAFLIEFRKDKEPKYFEDADGNWLTFEGIVFALNETKALNAEALLSLYLRDKHNFPNELDGHFVIKLYDASLKSYLVINDIVKNKTNFKCETSDYILFTPFSATTAAIKKPVPDLEALNEFLWRYYILSEKSMLEGVTRLLPASVYKISNSTLSREQYWEWPKKQTTLSFKETVDEMCRRMKESARMIADTFDKLSLDFTMGQDSRQVISSFTSQKIPFVTSTYGKDDFLEVQKVKETANKLGIENNTIKLNSDYSENLWSHFSKAVLLGSCEEPGYLLGRINYMRDQQAKHASVSVNGMDGNPYKNGLWDDMYMLNLYREPKAFKINHFVKLRTLSSNYPDSIFTSGFREIKDNSENYFKQLIKEAIKGYENSPVSMQVDRFDVYYWKNFVTTSNNSGNLLHRSISPLYLRRNIEWAMPVPARWRFNQSAFQRAIVYNLDPELAKMRTDFGGVNMVPKNFFTFIPHYIRFVWFQSNRLRKKIKSKLGFNVVTHLQEAWDYLPLYKKLLNDNSLKEHLKFENMYLKPLLKQEEWDAFLKKYDQPDELKMKDFEFLFKLVSVESFLKEAEKFAASA